MNSVISTIINRYSPRAFSNESISDQEINVLFEAARWAPSASNHQPWRFIIASRNSNQENYNKVFSSLVDFNKNWAFTAPVLIVAIAETNTSDGKDNKYAWYDTGQAVANISLQATAMSLYVHQMGGFNAESIKTEFNLNDSLQPICVIALGKLGNINELPEEIQQREFKRIRERKPFSEIVLK